VDESRLEISVVDRQRARRVSGAALRRVLRRAADLVPPPAGADVVIALVSDRRMRMLNRTWRARDATTDVLSFPGEGAAGPDGRVALGDVVVSVPTAARQARERGHSLARELATLVVHGYLHLLGYDHERDDGTMIRVERRVLRRVLPARRGLR
jgi:probable rRNA maturation factor